MEAVEKHVGLPTIGLLTAPSLPVPAAGCCSSRSCAAFTPHPLKEKFRKEKNLPLGKIQDRVGGSRGSPEVDAVAIPPPPALLLHLLANIIS
jgi:hypothetical protein